MSAKGDNVEGTAGYRVIASAKRAPCIAFDSTAGKRAKMSSSAASSSQQQWASIFGRDGLFSWKKSLGHGETCLRAEYDKPFARELEARSTGKKSGPVKVACFDLDGCLIRPKQGRTWPSATDPNDFEQAFRGTFERVKREYENGACIAIITNQDQTNAKSKRLDVWRAKMANIARAIDCPMLILAALARDGFRKPGRLMWDHGIVPCYVEAGGKREDIEVRSGLSEQVSFFVGDAAGRVGDHADTDRKWATNVGLLFYTPEEFFLGQITKPHTLSGWRPTLEAAQDEQGTLPSNFFAETTDKLDLVLFVGPPASGKTSFYREHFSGRDYEWINQDTLKTAARCHAAVRKSLTEGRSVVVDNTNRNVATRAHYIDLARELGNVQVRCVFFDVSKELCWHNNLYRVRAGLQPPDEPRQLLPVMAFSSFFSNLEKPTRDEGFDADVAVVKWSFRGGGEARRRWLMQWE